MATPSIALPLSVAILLLAGCADSPTPSQRPAGALDPGTASVSVKGAAAESAHAVSCLTDGPTTTISTGDAGSGTTAVVSNADGLLAESVQLRGIGGFTGSYWKDVAGRADVRLAGTTYTITGTADGFLDTAPSHRTSGDFSIQVAC
jgi:ipoprotein LpqH